MKTTASDMEIAVASLLNWRRYVIVPNVSWGLALDHECDLLALDADNRFTEIEIKTSISDLKKEQKKWHGHHSKIISRLVFAVPESILEKAVPLIPERCGIIVVFKTGTGAKARWHKQARHRKDFVPDAKTVDKFLRLGCMRIWTLKQKLWKKD